jgi:hypothetical protein
MNWLSLLGPLTPLAEKLIDRIPDKNARAEAQEELERLVLGVDAKARNEQTAINRQEAAHKSLFVAGWRPAVGWTCAFAFAYSFVLQPFGVMLAEISSQYLEFDFDPAQLPGLDMAPMMTVLMGMLGLGGLRTFEKLKGVSRER